MGTFPRSLTTTPFERSSTGRFEACPCRPASGGRLPSSVQHHELTLVFVTHTRAAAFASISRSSRNTLISRRSRLSSSRSVVVKPSLRNPSSSPACLSHWRIVSTVGSNSRASAVMLRPPRANSTIRRRYSAAYGGCVRGIWKTPSPYPQHPLRNWVNFTNAVTSVPFSHPLIPLRTSRLSALIKKRRHHQFRETLQRSHYVLMLLTALRDFLNQVRCAVKFLRPSHLADQRVRITNEQHVHFFEVLVTPVGEGTAHAALVEFERRGSVRTLAIERIEKFVVLECIDASMLSRLFARIAAVHLINARDFPRRRIETALAQRLAIESYILPDPIRCRQEEAAAQVKALAACPQETLRR